MTAGTTVLGGFGFILQTARTPSGLWTSTCGQCPWLGLFADHHEAHYTVTLHALVHHGHDMDRVGKMGTEAAVPTNRLYAQRRIEKMLA